MTSSALHRQSPRLSQRTIRSITLLTSSTGKSPSSTVSSREARTDEYKISRGLSRSGGEPVRPLARLPTTAVVRNVLLGVFFSSPLLFKPGFAILRAVAESRTSVLNPDKNPILRAILKPLLYDHFCAGSNYAEIQKTRNNIKHIGYSGIVLCYGKEVQVSKSNELLSTGSAVSSEIDQWKKGNLETLDMIGSGDWLGIKLTGAGKEVTSALIEEKAPPAEFDAALHLICERAAARKCRIWIDAEQQVVQKGIDRWTIALMRQYNRHGQALVYNTIQAYLKASREKLKEQLAISHREGWTLAIKLVRGAYINNEQRELIHDSKMETDSSYNGLVQDLLTGTNLGFAEDNFPKNIRLLLAGHNPHSISNALSLVNSLEEQGRLKVVPDFAQLQGMGDVTGCRFLSQCEISEDKTSVKTNGSNKLSMYKCVPWGNVQECMHYLFRRAVENSGGKDRIKDDLKANWGELKYRMFGSLG